MADLDELIAMGEQGAPHAIVPALSALAITVIWATFGWGWFDVSFTPWMIGAFPMAIIIAWGARSQGTRAQANLALVHRFVTLVQSQTYRDEEAKTWRDICLIASRTLVHRTVRDSHLEASEIEGPPPGVSAFDHASQRAPDHMTGPIQALHGLMLESTHIRQSREIPVFGCLSLYLATLPIGLVTTTGWWTAPVVAGLSLLFALIPVHSKSSAEAQARMADQLVDLTTR